MSFFSYDFTGARSLVRGDDWVPSFQWLQRTYNLDGTVTDTPVNLTGYTGNVRLTKPGSDVLLLNPAPGITLDADGHISWSVPASVTATLPKGDALLAVQLTDTLGKVSTRIFGTVRVI